MTSSNDVINAGIGYTVGNILIKGIGFLSIPLYTRLMNTSDYGIYNTYAAFVSIVTFVVCLGLDPTLKNAEYDFKDRRPAYLSTVYILTLSAFSILCIFLLPLHDMISPFLPNGRIIMLLLLLQAEGSAIINIYNIKLSLSFSSKNYLKIAFFNTICSILISVLLMLTIFNDSRYLGRIIGSLIPVSIVAICILGRNVLMIKGQKFSFEMAKYALVLGLPLIPHLISQVINSQFDRIMISTYAGYTEAGIYSFTYNIAVILQIIYQSLDNVWSPLLFKKMHEGNYENLKRDSCKYLMLMTFFTVGLMTISREIIMLFSPESYWDGIHLSQVLIAGIFFLYLYTLPAGIEYYTKNTRYIAIGSICTAILNIVLNFFAIRRFGYEAAAYTTLISYFILFVIHWLVYIRITPCKIYDFKKIILCIAGVLAWAVFSRLFDSLPLIKYGSFAVLSIPVFLYFKEDIMNYAINIKRKGR